MDGRPKDSDASFNEMLRRNSSSHSKRLNHPSSFNATQGNDIGLPPQLPTYMPNAAASLLPPNTITSIDDDDNIMPDRSKRPAQAGQWKTPPHTFFSTTASADGSIIQTPTFLPANQAVMPRCDDDVGIYNQSNTSIPSSASSVVGNGSDFELQLIEKLTGQDASQVGFEEALSGQPQILNVYRKLTEEEDRRTKRLNRNRASARNRRMRKKSQVEGFEIEVSELENVLKSFTSFKWGSHSIEEVRQVVGDPKQFVSLSLEDRRLFISALLGRCRDTTRQLIEAESSLWLLSNVARNSHQNSPLAIELMSVLNLSSKQVEKLSERFVFANVRAIRDLSIAEKCLSSLQSHNWLEFPGIDSLIDKVQEIITESSVKKLVEWSNLNKEAVERLDYINEDAPRKEYFMFTK